jgi:sec-independent protein translocase protein TatA
LPLNQGICTVYSEFSLLIYRPNSIPNPLGLAFVDPLQLIVIGIIAVVIFMWGPNKIPELARGIGRARREFDNASKGYSDIVSGKGSSVSAPERSGSEVLRETARRLGINADGKSDEQLSGEIIRKASGGA